MGIVIGMDEAGYGPNLGPLVVTVTVWEVPGDPKDIDFWSALADVVDRSPPRDASRLHVADSKQVYNRSRGIDPLERGVLSALGLCHSQSTVDSGAPLGLSAPAGEQSTGGQATSGTQFPGSFRELWRLLIADEDITPDVEPWFVDGDLPLPLAVHKECFEETISRWRACCEQHGIRLRTIRSDIVLTERFNRMVRQFDSKGVALSRVSMRLLRNVWDVDDPEPTQIIADKHGGRNRYDEFLAEVLDDRMIFRRQEGRQLSSYRVGSADVHFQAKAEAHFPVALASMVSKYVRELSMTLFNRFWANQVPGLKPTQGYPVDARRFKRDIAEAQARLGLSDDVLWRQR